LLHADGADDTPPSWGRQGSSVTLVSRKQARQLGTWISHRCMGVGIGAAASQCSAPDPPLVRIQWSKGSTKLTTAQYGSSRVLVVLGFILSRLRLFIRYVTSLPMWPRPRPELGERGGEGEASRTCQNANVSQTTSQNHALSLDIRMDTSIHVAHNRARPLSCRADALLG